MTWDWAFAVDIFPTILAGLRTTVIMTAAGSLAALSIGLGLELLRRGSPRVLSLVVVAFVEFIRSTPLLTQLYFAFYVLPAVGITLGALETGVLGLGVHFGAYAAEVYRGGIDNVARGQWEAAVALSLPRRRVWLGIILPQAARIVLPAQANYIITMFKATPLLSTITITEMLYQARVIGAASLRYLEPMVIVGVLFLVVSYPTARLVNSMEKKLGATRS